MSTAKFETAMSALDYMLAGNATVTLVSKKTGARFTYKISKPTEETENGGKRRSHDAQIAFVSLLNGPDNTSDYMYLGLINLERNEFFLTKKSSAGPDAPSVRGFQYAFGNLARKSRLPEDVEIWHEGYCGRCGRELTVPSSIAAGIGPECAKHFGLHMDVEDMLPVKQLEEMRDAAPVKKPRKSRRADAANREAAQAQSADFASKLRTWGGV